MTFSSFRKTTISRLISFCLMVTFVTSMVITPRASAQGVAGLPEPGTMVSLSSAYVPMMITGLTIHPENPLLMDFIVNTGNTGMGAAQVKVESDRLIKYFLACLTIPENNQWVNLSPYEKDRIIPDDLGATVLGQDMLAQDYLLKQLSASLIYPEKNLGKNFWDKVYTKASQMYGTTQIPLNTFNKVWILPDTAQVYEHKDTVFVVKSHLKVMLDADYLALSKHSSTSQVNSIGSQVVRQVILPAIEEEVNTGKNFAQMRQIYNSMILAFWFKTNLKKALLNQVYTDRSKVNGVNVDDPAIKEKIYQQYLDAYKKGVFNYIKEEVDQNSNQVIPRKYFSGGLTAVKKLTQATSQQAMSTLGSEPGVNFRVSGLTQQAMKNAPKAPPAEATLETYQSFVDQLGPIGQTALKAFLESIIGRSFDKVKDDQLDKRFAFFILRNKQHGIFDIPFSEMVGNEKGVVGIGGAVNTRELFVKRMLAMRDGGRWNGLTLLGFMHWFVDGTKFSSKLHQNDAVKKSEGVALAYLARTLKDWGAGKLAPKTNTAAMASKAKVDLHSEVGEIFRGFEKQGVSLTNELLAQRAKRARNQAGTKRVDRREQRFFQPSLDRSLREKTAAMSIEIKEPMFLKANFNTLREIGEVQNGTIGWGDAQIDLRDEATKEQIKKLFGLAQIPESDHLNSLRFIFSFDDTKKLLYVGILVDRRSESGERILTVLSIADSGETGTLDYFTLLSAKEHDRITIIAPQYIDVNAEVEIHTGIGFNLLPPPVYNAASEEIKGIVQRFLDDMTVEYKYTLDSRSVEDGVLVTISQTNHISPALLPMTIEAHYQNLANRLPEGKKLIPLDSDDEYVLKFKITNAAMSAIDKKPVPEDLPRIELLKRVFARQYTTKLSVIARGNGRFVFEDDHRDYPPSEDDPNAFNQLLSGALPQNILVAGSASQDPDLVNVYSIDREVSASFKISEMIALFDSLEKDPARAEQIYEAYKKEGKEFIFYFMGIYYGMLKGTSGTKYTPKGANFVIQGNIPIGAGTSSSAALSVGASLALSNLFSLGIEKDPEEWLTVSQFGESEKANMILRKVTGRLDQGTSIRAEEGNLWKNIFSVKGGGEQVPLKLPPTYDIVIINSQLEHDLSSGLYGYRYAELKMAPVLLNAVLGTQRGHVSAFTYDEIRKVQTELPAFLASKSKDELQTLVNSMKEVKNAKGSIDEKVTAYFKPGSLGHTEFGTKEDISAFLTTVFKRSRHVVEGYEKRSKEAERIMRDDSIPPEQKVPTLMRIIRESGESLSMDGDFQVSGYFDLTSKGKGNHVAALDELVRAAQEGFWKEKGEDMVSVLRMMGGGSGGSAIGIVRKDVYEQWKEFVKKQYLEKTGIQLTDDDFTVIDKPAEGSGLVWQAPQAEVVSLEKSGFSPDVQEQISTINAQGGPQIITRIDAQTQGLVLDVKLDDKTSNTIMPLGWRMISAVVNGQETVEQGRNRNEPWSGVHQMGPWEGRIKDGLLANPNGKEPVRLNLPGLKPFIDKEGNGHPHHGVIDKLPWEITKVVKEGDGVAVSAVVDSRKYPALVKSLGEFTYEITYHFTKNGFSISSKRKNMGTTPIRLEYGPHPWIIGNGEGVLLQFKAKTRVTVDDKGIANGVEPIMAGSKYDFSTPKPVDPKKIALDFTFADLEADENGLVTVKVIDTVKNTTTTYQWKKSEMPFMQIWNGNPESLSIEGMSSYAGAGAQGVHLEGYETPLAQPGEERQATFTVKVEESKVISKEPRVLSQSELGAIYEAQQTGDLKTIQEMQGSLRKSMLNDYELAWQKYLATHPGFKAPFDLADPNEQRFVYTKEEADATNLRDHYTEFVKKSNASTAGIRAFLDILHSENPNKMYNDRFLALLVAAEAEFLVDVHDKEIKQKLAGITDMDAYIKALRENMGAKNVAIAEEIFKMPLESIVPFLRDNVVKLVGGEVRPHTAKFVEMESRILAQQGIKVITTEKYSDSVTIYMFSYLTYLLGAVGATDYTSSHSSNYLAGRKALAPNGSQLLPDVYEKYRTILKRKIDDEIYGKGQTEVILGAANNENILKTLSYDRMTKLYSSIVNLTPKDIQEINESAKLGHRIVLNCLNGSTWKTLQPLMKNLGINTDVFIPVMQDEDAYFKAGYEVLKKKGPEGQSIYSIDHIGVDTTMPRVARTIPYPELLKGLPVGTRVFEADPDSDRFVVKQIQEATPKVKDQLEEFGIDFYSLEGDKILIAPSPNKSFLMLDVADVEKMIEDGTWDQYLSLYLITYVSSKAWVEFADAVDGLMRIMSMVGFKNLAELRKKVEDWYFQTKDREFTFTDNLGREVTINRDKQIRFHALEEESGGRVAGLNSPSYNLLGQKVLAMPEKSAADSLFSDLLFSSKKYLAAAQELKEAIAGTGAPETLNPNSVLAEANEGDYSYLNFLSRVFKQYGLKSKIDVRIDIIHGNQGDIAKLESGEQKKAMAKSEAIKVNFNNFFFSIGKAVRDGNLDLPKAINMLTRILPQYADTWQCLTGMTLTEEPLAGGLTRPEGVPMEFEPKDGKTPLVTAIRFRPSGTDPLRSKVYLDAEKLSTQQRSDFAKAFDALQSYDLYKVLSEYGVTPIIPEPSNFNQLGLKEFPVKFREVLIGKGSAHAVAKLDPKEVFKTLETGVPIALNSKHPTVQIEFPADAKAGKNYFYMISYEDANGRKSDGYLEIEMGRDNYIFWSKPNYNYQLTNEALTEDWKNIDGYVRYAEGSPNHIPVAQGRVVKLGQRVVELSVLDGFNFTLRKEITTINPGEKMYPHKSPVAFSHYLKVKVGEDWWNGAINIDQSRSETRVDVLVPQLVNFSKDMQKGTPLLVQDKEGRNVIEVGYEGNEMYFKNVGIVPLVFEPSDEAMLSKELKALIEGYQKIINDTEISAVERNIARQNLESTLEIVRRDIDAIAVQLSADGRIEYDQIKKIDALIADIRTGKFKLKGESADILKPDQAKFAELKNTTVLEDGQRIIDSMKVKGNIDRGIAENLGYFHQTANAIVLTPEEKILVQTRALWQSFGLFKSIYGGHLTTGVKHLEGVAEELDQELNLNQEGKLKGKLKLSSFDVYDKNGENNKEVRSLFVYKLDDSEWAKVKLEIEKLQEAREAAIQALTGNNEIDPELRDKVIDYFKYPDLSPDFPAEIRAILKDEEQAAKLNPIIKIVKDVFLNALKVNGSGLGEVWNVSEYSWDNLADQSNIRTYTPDLLGPLMTDSQSGGDSLKDKLKRTIDNINQAGLSRITPEGGIDLSSKTLKMQSEGQKVDITFNPAMMAQFERGDFSGVRIKILDVVEINPVQLLGLK